jgi:hypothetical protein
MKNWASTQKTVARSSGEAEYYALVKVLAEALGFQSVARDLGWEMPIRIWIDSSAAKGIASRAGLGKLRHLEVSFLWVQQALKEKKFVLRKIAGDKNPADVLTKPLSASEMGAKMKAVGAVAMRRAQPKRWADMTAEDDSCWS